MSVEIKDEMIIRPIKHKDISEVVRTAEAGFGTSDVSFKKDEYENHINTFPEGQECVEYKGKIVGSSSSVIINYDEFGHDHTLEDIAPDGFINHHTYDGKNLYGTDVVVHPDYRGMKIGSMLYKERRRLCQAFNLESIIFGGRIPNYHKYADKYPVKEYVKRVQEGEIFDPILVFQLRKGFEVKDVKSGYLKDDVESLEYATIMEWKNPDYQPNNSNVKDT